MLSCFRLNGKEKKRECKGDNMHTVNNDGPSSYEYTPSPFSSRPAPVLKTLNSETCYTSSAFSSRPVQEFKSNCDLKNVNVLQPLRSGNISINFASKKVSDKTVEKNMQVPVRKPTSLKEISMFLNKDEHSDCYNNIQPVDKSHTSRFRLEGLNAPQTSFDKNSKLLSSHNEHKTVKNRNDSKHKRRHGESKTLDMKKNEFHSSNHQNDSNSFNSLHRHSIEDERVAMQLMQEMKLEQEQEDEMLAHAMITQDQANYHHKSHSNVVQDINMIDQIYGDNLLAESMSEQEIRDQELAERLQEDNEHLPYGTHFYEPELSVSINKKNCFTYMYTFIVV